MEIISFVWRAHVRLLQRCQLWNKINVVVNFLSEVIFVFPLILSMVMYAIEGETKGKEKLLEIKN